MEDILYGKTLVALGDSLFYGNKLGNEATWINKLGKKHNMTVYNYGINGNTVAMQEDEPKTPPMCVRYADMADGADYVVVLGGANDKRLHVPIGKDDDTDPHTFKGALNVLILGITDRLRSISLAIGEFHTAKPYFTAILAKARIIYI